MHPLQCIGRCRQGKIVNRLVVIHVLKTVIIVIYPADRDNIKNTSTLMLPSPPTLLLSSPPKHRMARLAISALYGQLLVASVRRSRLSIPCFRASILFFLIMPARISRPSKYTFIFFETVSPHPASTVVIGSIGIPVFFSSFSFIYQHQIFSLRC